MLVDNAIVVTEGILIGSQKGLSKVEAAVDTVKNTATPLLGATAVAVLAFAAIGLSQDGTGEYCRALFQVILISLLLSWVFAVTVTPLVGDLLLKSEASDEDVDPYAGKVYQLYRGFLETCLRNRWATSAVVVLVFVASLWGFGYVQQSFFPDSTRPQFYIDLWLPEGTHIRSTQAEVERLDEWIRELDHVTSTASFVGQGALRFQLTYTAEDVNPSFGHIIVSVDDWTLIDQLGEQIETHIRSEFPNAEGWYKKFIVGPGGGAKIEARFRGPDALVLRSLSEKAKAIMQDDPVAVNVRDDWRQRVKILRPVYAETQARVAGVTRPDLANALLMAYDGRIVGQYREADEILPIISRAPQRERDNVYDVNNVQVWASGTGRSVPVSQVVSEMDTVYEDQIIRRFNRLRTIQAQCEQASGTAETVRRRIAPKIEAIELPPGYSLEWRGEFGSSQDAQVALSAKLPPTFMLMVLIVIVLFDRIRQPAIIYLTLPLALIGVTVGLLVTKNPFGFMAMLGLLSLSGMLIKNAIVLIDETDKNIREGMERYEAVVIAGVSRMRPVAMAALTTMLGMIPLFQDAFFRAMAVTIVFGLGFATVLTLIVVPTLYAIFFRIHPSPAETA
jgi:multidrug efflux pump subunit AcrB